ncbi:MAG: DEAD/DEAH box helicase [Phycisphaerales bacterium]|nr:DEAD/DEAH box helicase [Phycisphaerales bacterium]
MTASRPSSSRSSARSSPRAKPAPKKGKPAAKPAARGAGARKRAAAAPKPKARIVARAASKPAAKKAKPAPKTKAGAKPGASKPKPIARKPLGKRPVARQKPPGPVKSQREITPAPQVAPIAEPLPAMVSFDEPREPLVPPFTPARPELRPSGHRPSQPVPAQPPSTRPPQPPSPPAPPPAPRDLHRPAAPDSNGPAVGQPHRPHGQPPRDQHPHQPRPRQPAWRDQREHRDQADRRDHRDQRPHGDQRDHGRRDEHDRRPAPTPTAAPGAPSVPAAAAPVTAPVSTPAAPPPPAEPALSATAEAARKHREEIFDKQTRFADLGLSEQVMRGVNDAGFVYPTAIQARLIPLILSGRDMLGQAKTGTGKTAAFGLPLLSRIEKGRPFQALVLVPTRELAIQVATDLRELGRFTGLNILPVYGGQNVSTQAQLLAKGPEVIVATPGRVMDMVQRNYMNYRGVKMVVLDEVDRMLDIGFRDDIRRILGSCPKDRQTIFVSATISSDIESLARSFANNAEKIIASAGSLTVSMVAQHHLSVQPWDKKQLLLHLLTHEDPALTVVFCRTKRTVDNLTEYLSRKGVDCHAIHGDMYQNKRNKVMERLRSGKLEVLVASDVASRGLDVEGITHVINYDLPEDPDLYVHRIGRTARAGRDGVAWSLVTPEQGGLLTEIELFINAEIPKLDYPDFKPGPIPPDVLARQQQDTRRVENARQFSRFAGPGSPAYAGAPTGVPAAAQPTSVASPSHPDTPSPRHPATPMTPAAPDPTRFPGGIVPSQAPLKRMFGKVKTARSMKQAMAQQPQPQPQQVVVTPQATASESSGTPMGQG